MPKVVILSPQSFKKSDILKGKKFLHGESYYIWMQRNQSETKDSSMSPSRGSIMMFDTIAASALSLPATSTKMTGQVILTKYVRGAMLTSQRIKFKTQIFSIFT